MNAYKKLGVGIIGCGGMGKGHARQLKEISSLEFIAVAETNKERREKICDEFGVQGYEDYHELLQRRDIDLIHNATPSFLHARITIDALKAGKHVFSEKPMGLSRVEMSDILRAEKESGKLLQIDFEMRFGVLCKRIKELIDAGELGEVKSIYFIHSGVGVGFVKKSGDWRADPAKVGGYYFEEGCHRLDLFRYWMGEEVAEVEAIPATELQGPDGWHRGYKEPISTLCFFSGGKVANLVTLPHRGLAIPSSEIVFPMKVVNTGWEFGASLTGTDGSIRADFIERYIQLFRFEGPDGRAESKRIENYIGIPEQKLWHDTNGFFIDFAERILKGREPFMMAADSWKTMAVVLACEESLRQNGERIDVDYELA